MIKDPVCGMEIEPQSAHATREHMGQMFYFCSQSCVDQFDADPHKYVRQAIPNASEKPLAGSITTGFNPALPLARIELPIVGLKKDGRRKAVETALRDVPGVRAAKVNVGSGMALVEYDPRAATTEALVGAVKSAGDRIGGAQTRIGVENLRCASCVVSIEEALAATPGVLNATVNVGTQEATVKYLPEKTTLSQLREAIEAAGYKTRPAASEEPEDKQRAEHAREYHRLMSKFWLAAVISIPVLITAYPQFVPVVRDWPLETLRLAWVGAAHRRARLCGQGPARRLGCHPLGLGLRSLNGSPVEKSSASYTAPPGARQSDTLRCTR
jgi:Cu+-exporting ATPase